MKTPIFQVDAFTRHHFKGNPAAVCLLDEERTAEWMQAVAQEMNLSETAFLIPLEKEYQLRWFTPKMEVDLCGHGTLASAFVLFSEGYLKEGEVVYLHTRSGLLTAERTADWITLDFPAYNKEKPFQSAKLLDALHMTHGKVSQCGWNCIVELDSAEQVRNISPDFDELASICSQGVSVTSRSDDPDYDFISRFFAPGLGINEDPVTGSAHCSLGPYWERRLGKDELTAFQASQRGGVVKIELQGERVKLLGQAIMVWKGDLLC
ncbi:MAG TPA: PhzF family phenazine biosynthesis protein [Anaerolineae bacterium]|nr:PhzF family phenazine biosynthesis protein [Anaerolineae bacterium]